MTVEQQSPSRFLDSGKLFDDHQYNGLMGSTYVSSSLPSQGAFHRNYRSHPVNDFNEQYNELQQARMQQQKKTQNEALWKQQQTFAMRQKLNPPLTSRQPSASNLNQSHISTQTTSSVQCSPTMHQPSTLIAPNPSTTTNTPNSLFPNTQKFEYNSQQHQQEQQEQKQILSSKPIQLQLQHDQQQLFRKLQNDLRMHLRHTTSQSRSDEHRFNNEIHTDGEFGARSPMHQMRLYKGEQMSGSSAASSPTKLLKSPKTKRQPTALVTFSGWLYKQGSDGLRVWRKRWFVLTEYCLFYYKGPEEDKLLGSILLPSYTLSECLLHENKAYRKFSFKLEHTNMRTYYLASENGDYLRKWMRVIRAATLMQNFNEVLAVDARAHNTSGDEPEERSALAQTYGQLSHNNNNNPFLNGSDEPNERQPLYANAPPKPRRSHNDAEYSTFTSEMLFPLR